MLVGRETQCATGADEQPAGKSGEQPFLDLCGKKKQKEQTQTRRDKNTQPWKGNLPQN
jgi:hypothetical protein